MADASTYSIDTEAALDEALGRARDMEHAVTKTRDALHVIARALEHVAERHAGAEARELTQDDVSTLYGAVSLIEYAADECDRAYWARHAPI